MSETHTFEIGDYDNGWKEHLCSVCAELQSNAIHADTTTPRATNAELLRLLERHHAASIEEDCFLSADAPQYYGSELYLQTAAAIVEAKKDSHGQQPIIVNGDYVYGTGLGDQLRTRVPTWTCAICSQKFYSRAEYDAHGAEESANG